VRARVFIARGGNSCITPMYAGKTESDASMNYGTPAGMFAIMAGIEDTGTCVDVEDGQEMRNVPVRLCSSGFEHGAIDLICIAGPLLDGVTHD
jgi:hypothetical protein